MNAAAGIATAPEPVMTSWLRHPTSNEYLAREALDPGTGRGLPQSQFFRTSTIVSITFSVSSTDSTLIVSSPISFAG